MDKITESLQSFLRKKHIRYQTMFNSTEHWGLSNMTSTCFHLTKGNFGAYISFVIDIDPGNGKFYLSSYPADVIDQAKILNEIRSYVNQWNRSGNPFKLILEEEKGIPEPNVFCISLYFNGIAPIDGMGTKQWEHYIRAMYQECLRAWNKVDEIKRICKLSNDGNAPMEQAAQLQD